MIDNIKELISFGSGNVVIIIFILFILTDQICELAGKFLARFFNLQTKWAKKEKEKKIIAEHEKTIRELKKEKELVEKHEETIKELKEETDKINVALLLIIRALLSITRKEIVSECRRLQKEKVTSINTSDYETLDGLFKSYFALGGNHVVSKLYDWFENLKIE